jgi:CheY-like chemotaxis protein
MARILLIEDDDSLRRAVEKTLMALGHEVVAAVNGVDGLAQFRTERVDLVVTDLLMSYGGLTTIRLLRRNHPDLRIVAISGSAAHLETARELGANRTLIKPFTPAQLGLAIAELLTPPKADKKSPGKKRAKRAD